MNHKKRVAKDDLRAKYKREDFPAGFVRGKYAKRIQEASNVVVLEPEVAEVFPNEKAVNDALLALIKIAQSSTSQSTRPGGRSKTRAVQ